MNILKTAKNPELGIITFRSNRRSKRLSIRVKGRDNIIVTLPVGYPVKHAEKFVLEKKEWIKKSLQNLEKKKNVSIIAPDNPYQTKLHLIEFFPVNNTSYNIYFNKGKVRVDYPELHKQNEHMLADNLKKCIEEILRREAKIVIPDMVIRMAAKHDLSFNQISVKNMVTRWGSCSGKRNLNFSLHLMRIPDHLIEYVVLHELAHLTVRNHGKNFWTLLDKYCNGKARQLDKEMRNYTARW